MGYNLNNNWFAQNVVKILGNGTSTRFWEDIWVGETPLKERFPRLYSISIQRAATVAEIYTVSDSSQWSLLWRRRLFVWEEELRLELLESIATITLSDRDDRWKWVPDKGEVFTVNSTFLLISDFTVLSVLMPCWHASAFSAIWKCPALSKVNAFAWQLLHDQIPTRHNLLHRRIIEENGDISCVLCGEALESSLHLFIYCEVAHKVWVGVFNWLDVPFSLPHNLFSILNLLIQFYGKKTRKGMCMIWNSVVWSLWRCRNSVLFDNGRQDWAVVLEEVKVMTWKWWLSNSKVGHSLLYEWRVQPRLCMLR
ncbi:putative non-LTR retroelement reverse transcriptase related [Trifolium medium]|uniref:Putative non-LTR retroelement reverse transcriptase related n=1 Tax=Trifolium medium TaxID=97028 RepID=A0A392NC96_9FABA|nr:putative non-LTR retroelement reverse transcriptase related [Trifolium medium]